MMQAERTTTAYLEFKDKRVESEWMAGFDPDAPAGTSLHPALVVVVAAAGHWIFRATGRRAVLTHLLRTRSEQERIYPGEPERRSPHEYGRAADFRVRNLPADLAGEWEAWLNAAFGYLGRAGSRTAILHETGGRGMHLHVQVGPAEPRPR